jgi:hypothetical protein
MAFIAIDTDTSWQDMYVAQEIATSYNRRRMLFGLSEIATPTADTLVHDFVLALQTGIEEMMGYDYFGYGTFYGWLLNTAALSSYEGQTAAPTPLTQDAGMTAAGLTASGYWRRIAEGGTQPATWTNYAADGWSYGKIESKDLAGPWLWKDIQLALSALTRAKLPFTQTRYKGGYYFGSGPTIPSTAMSFGSWGTSGLESEYIIGKTKTGSSITSIGVQISIAEFRFDINSIFDALESDRLMLTMPFDGSPSYASKAAKMAYDNLGVADVSTMFDKTVSNTSTKSVSGGTLSYYAILAEDASNLIPIANDILPDSSIPSDSSVGISLRLQTPDLIIDFNFE